VVKQLTTGSESTKTEAHQVLSHVVDKKSGTSEWFACVCGSCTWVYMGFTGEKKFFWGVT